MAVQVNPWISNLVSEEHSRQLGRWFHSSPSCPTVIPEILPPDLADLLAEELESSREWHREAWLRSADGEVESSDEEGLFTAPASRRFSVNDVLDRIDRIPADLHPQTKALMLALADGSVAEFFSEVVGTTLQRVPSMEVTRYRKGDFLANHSDTHAARMVGMIIYLAPAWQPADGGRFAYRDEFGKVSHFDPVFNSAVLLPFRTDCEHWVEPITGDHWRRLGLSAHYAAAG